FLLGASRIGGNDDKFARPRGGELRQHHFKSVFAVADTVALEIGSIFVGGSFCDRLVVQKNADQKALGRNRWIESPAVTTAFFNGVNASFHGFGPLRSGGGIGCRCLLCFPLGWNFGRDVHDLPLMLPRHARYAMSRSDRDSVPPWCRWCPDDAHCH